MSVNYVYIMGRRKYARPITTESEYRNIRNSARNINNLRKARLGDDAAKRRLVQMNYSGYYPRGVVAGSKYPSKAFGFDIDDRDAFEIVAKKLLSAPEKYGLLMLERSVSQGGHAIFKREIGRTILENQVRIACELECEMDCKAHDINRVYFTTGNDDLLYISQELFNDTCDEEASQKEYVELTEREVNGEEELPDGAHSNIKHFKPWQNNRREHPNFNAR